MKLVPVKVEVVETTNWIDVTNYIKDSTYTKSIYVIGFKVFEKSTTYTNIIPPVVAPTTVQSSN